MKTIMIKLMISIIKFKIVIIIVTKTSQLAQNWSKSNPNYT